MAATAEAAPQVHDERLEKLNVQIESGVTPKTSEAYTKKDYWDWRFEREETYDWLATYSDIAEFLSRHIAVDDRILLIGCGNSTLTADMADAGFKHLTSTDISEVCIQHMRSKHAESHPNIKWEVADMLQLDSVFPAASFDVVLDKAGMDAVLAHKGDVWEAPPQLLAQTYTVCKQVQRMLVPSGKFLSLSFGQPHFRLQYFGVQAGGGDCQAEREEGAPQQDSSGDDALAAVGVPQWASINKEAVDVGFGYFWYILVS